MTERLTTLAAVKDWLDIPDDNTTGDPAVVRVIEAASQYVTHYLNRSGFSRSSHTEFVRGNGRSSMLLRNWPVLSITSVDIGGGTVTASTFNRGVPTSGFYIGERRSAPMSLEVFGHSFWRDAPVQIVYDAGFEASQVFTLLGEDSAPDPAVSYGVSPGDKGQWIGDVGVKMDGDDMIKISTGVPVSGEYLVDEWGVYAFAYADVGEEIVITYSYVPFDISHAATELVGEWLKRKDRIGLISKGLGGQENVTFSIVEMNASVRGMLQPYVNVVPV